MAEALDELCALVADVGVQKAHELTVAFDRLLSEKAGLKLDKSQFQAVFFGFAFVNWSLANGVWSNLGNARLRRDLMSASRTKFISKAVQSIEACDDVHRMAYRASEVDLDDFPAFAEGWLDRMKQIDATGQVPDARAALTVWS
jgi:hypothetical protein